MKLWRDAESADGWFPEGVDLLPSLTIPLVISAVVLIGLGAVVALVRFGHRS